MLTPQYLAGAAPSHLTVSADSINVLTLQYSAGAAPSNLTC
jgi:hypothetical protein